jgi:hypothetical protein
METATTTPTMTGRRQSKRKSQPPERFRGQDQDDDACIESTTNTPVLGTKGTSSIITEERETIPPKKARMDNFPCNNLEDSL